MFIPDKKIVFIIFKWFSPSWFCTTTSYKWIYLKPTFPIGVSTMVNNIIQPNLSLPINISVLSTFDIETRWSYIVWRLSQDGVGVYLGPNYVPCSFSRWVIMDNNINCFSGIIYRHQDDFVRYVVNQLTLVFKRPNLCPAVPLGVENPLMTVLTAEQL